MFYRKLSANLISKLTAVLMWHCLYHFKIVFPLRETVKPKHQSLEVNTDMSGQQRLLLDNLTGRLTDSQLHMLFKLSITCLSIL